MVGKGVSEAADQQAYRNYQINEALYSSLEYSSDYRKYVIWSYLYIRSRLGVPGRSYESEYSGMLPLGGPAHCDVMDLDRWLVNEGTDRIRRDVIEWILDSSPEQIAYYRGLARAPKAPNISRRRKQLAEKAQNFTESDKSEAA